MKRELAEIEVVPSFAAEYEAHLQRTYGLPPRVMSYGGATRQSLTKRIHATRIAPVTNQTKSKPSTATKSAKRTPAADLAARLVVQKLAIESLEAKMSLGDPCAELERILREP